MEFSESFAQTSTATSPRPGPSKPSGLTLVLPALKGGKPIKLGKKTNAFEEEKKAPRPVKLKPLKEVLSKLIVQIKKKDDYAFFLKPVDATQVPGYSDVVKRPMDLGTMTTKVERGKYRSLDDFAADLKLVASNAKAFNPPESIYYTEAERIEAWGLDHIVKAAATVIQYETDWNIEIENDDESTPVVIDDDGDYSIGTPMDVDDPSIVRRSPSVSSQVQPGTTRRAARGPYKKTTSQAPSSKVAETVDSEGRLPGSRDGLAAFPSGSDWARTLLALKLKDLKTVPPPNVVAEVGEDFSVCQFSNQETVDFIFSKDFNFPSAVPKVQKPCHRLGPSFGGLGLFATKPLSLGDLIYAERPLLVAPPILEGYILGDGDTHISEEETQLALSAVYEQGFRDALDRMQPHRQAAYLSLSDVYQNPVEPLHGIYRTNCIGVDLGVDCQPEDGADLQHGVIMAQLSRLNHSCIPNAAITFSPSSFSVQLHAIRTIAEGEEIFVNYTRVTRPAEVRQQTLDDFKFKCTCPACTNPGPNAQAILALLLGQYGRPSQYDDENLFYNYDDSEPQPDFWEMFEGSLKRLRFAEEAGLEITAAYDSILKEAATAAWRLGADDKVMEFLRMREKWTRAVRGLEIVYTTDSDGALLLDEKVYLRPV
ncbi:hypothetical protein H0H93_016066 [Arthromyces matolae]|nr:hypothetical protein H0H93_016066 [Arthromyces matolae]